MRRFSALGADLPDFVVQALELADEYGVDGLLGMNFLEQYNFTVRPRDQQIHLEPVAMSLAPPGVNGSDGRERFDKGVDIAWREATTMSTSWVNRGSP